MLPLAVFPLEASAAHREELLVALQAPRLATRLMARGVKAKVLAMFYTRLTYPLCQRCSGELSGPARTMATARIRSRLGWQQVIRCFPRLRLTGFRRCWHPTESGYVLSMTGAAMRIK